MVHCVLRIHLKGDVAKGLDELPSGEFMLCEFDTSDILKVT
jgi:hypothetical protein